MSTDIQSALQTSKLVPDVLKTIPSDLKLLGVWYGGEWVQPGQQLPRNQVLPQPTLKCEGLEAGHYVLLMVDPDLFVKDDPVSKQVRHWLANVTVDEEGKVAVSTDVSQYVPSTPGAGTGAHRYLFVLFKGNPIAPSTYANTTDEDLKTRMGFITADFVKENNLEPVAANFMLIAADARSTLENLGLAGQSVANKIKETITGS